MEADCRLPSNRLRLPSSIGSLITAISFSVLSTLRTKEKSIASIFLLTFLLIVHQQPVCSLSLDCDSVKNCICSKEDNGGWRIECPNEYRFQYPIELKVQRYDVSNNEASLTVQCDDTENQSDPWSYIKGMDFSVQKVDAKIIRLEINFCPPVQDGWKQFLKQSNLTGTDIRIFTFVTDDRSDVEIPTNFFESMPNIEALNLRNNKLTTVPDLSSLKNLQSINFRANEIQVIPPNAFTQNTQLTSIRLTGNKISDIAPETFPTSLEHLELNENLISRINSSVFANMIKLKRLYLNGNPLDGLDSDTFDGMPALEDLRLDNSRMTQFPDFNDLPSLINLTISNEIRYTILTRQGDITTTLAPEYLPENTLVLKNLPSLENLRLPLNHFASLPTLENLPKLRSIDLQRNQLTEITSGAFTGLPSLKVVNLARNRIKNLGKINAKSLLELDVSRNQLTELHNETFFFLTTLKKLNLAVNKIYTVSYKAMEPLADLEELDLSYNNVTFSAYSGSSDYLFGDLVSNQSPLRSSFSLKRLKLSHNSIDRLGYSDWAQVFTQINEIDLSYNKIKRITANELNFISSNLTLNLENNEISVVDMRMSFLLNDNSAQSKEIRVSLNGNPLECDCLAFGLKLFKSESYDVRLRNLSCNSPPDLRGKLLTDVPDDSLLCAMEVDKGCPALCMCKERTVDKTVLIDCSGKNLTDADVPPLDTFKSPYSKWMVELDLSDNEIIDFNNSIYIQDFLNKTRHINLSGNKLTSALFLEKLEDYQPTTFAIAENPFPCSNCAGFQTPWRAYSTRISDLANVTCQTVSGDAFDRDNDVLLVKEIKDLGEFCTSKLSTLVLPLVVAVIFLSCLCIGLFVTIKYGWAIKAYLYSKGLDWCLFWESELEEDEDGNEKLYDAFVSYSHKDEEWVIDELVHRLEENGGFKLCLHFRDWTPGDWIPDQIVRSVDKSRRTIVVLSKNFVESVWSRLEFKAAHAQALKERSNRVILILLGEDLKECDVQDDDLKMYMKMNTFMKWNDPLFWHRLKYALPHKKSGSSADDKQQVINKIQQRERAIQLDKLRAKLEQNV